MKTLKIFKKGMLWDLISSFDFVGAIHELPVQKTAELSTQKAVESVVSQNLLFKFSGWLRNTQNVGNWYSSGDAKIIPAHVFERVACYPLTAPPSNPLTKYFPIIR